MYGFFGNVALMFMGLQEAIIKEHWILGTPPFKLDSAQVYLQEKATYKLIEY